MSLLIGVPPSDMLSIACDAADELKHDLRVRNVHEHAVVRAWSDERHGSRYRDTIDGGHGQSLRILFRAASANSLFCALGETRKKFE